MYIELSKQAQKFLRKTDKNTATKIEKALLGIEYRKNVNKLTLSRGGMKEDVYRAKLEHYRIIFVYLSNEKIYVREIVTKNSATYRRTHCCF